MPIDDGPDREPYSRRDALKAFSSVAGVAVVAGCSGNNSSNDGQSVDQSLRWPAARSGDPLTEHETNPDNPKNYDETIRLIYARTGGKSRTTGQWMDLDEVKHNESQPSKIDAENNEQRLTLKDGVHWHQGTEIVDEVTAEDWKVTLELNRLMTPAENRPDEPMVVGWRVEGKNNKTLVQELNPNGWNENLATQLSQIQANAYRKGWRADKLKALKDATTTEEKNNIRTEVQQKSVTLSDDPILSGSWMLESVNQNKAMFKRNPKHWSAEKTTFNNFELIRLGGGGNAGYQGLQTDRIDLQQGGLPSAVTNVPENIVEVSSAPGAGFGWSLVISYVSDKVDPWLRVDQENGVVPARAGKVRQAIAHVISESDCIQNQLGSRAASTISPFPKQTLIGTAAAKERFPDVVSKIEKTAGQNTDIASQRLKSVGLTKENGIWVKPNGETLTLTLQSYASNRSLMETIKEDLNSFGLDVEHSTPETSVVFSQLSDYSFGAVQVWCTISPFEANIDNRVGAGFLKISQNKVKFEIPPTIGDYEGEASETYDAIADYQKLISQTVEANNEILPKLLWTFAYHMPNINLFPYPNQTMINTNNFEWPQPVPQKADNGVAIATEKHHPLWGLTENWRQLRRGIPSISTKTR